MFLRVRYTWAVLWNRFPLDGMECGLSVVANYLIAQSLVLYLLSWSMILMWFDLSLLLKWLARGSVGLSFVSITMIFRYHRYSAWEYYLPLFKHTKRQAQEKPSVLYTQPLCEVGEVVRIEGEQERNSRLVQCGA